MFGGAEILRMAVRIINHGFSSLFKKNVSFGSSRSILSAYLERKFEKDIVSIGLQTEDCHQSLGLFDNQILISYIFQNILRNTKLYVIIFNKIKSEVINHQI